MASELKEKITFVSLVLALSAVLAGYGVWVGKVSARIDTLETRTEKVEKTIDSQIEKMAKNINELTVQTAVLSEKVDRLREEVKNNAK